MPLFCVYVLSKAVKILYLSCILYGKNNKNTLKVSTFPLVLHQNPIAKVI